jgi:hypothetical protein
MEASDRLMAYGFGKLPQRLMGHFTEYTQKKQILARNSRPVGWAWVSPSCGSNPFSSLFASIQLKDLSCSPFTVVRLARTSCVRPERIKENPAQRLPLLFEEIKRVLDEPRGSLVGIQMLPSSFEIKLMRRQPSLCSKRRCGL